MRRQYVGQTGQHLNSVFQSVERTCAGIALVALHNGGPLLVAHGTCTGVGQQVDEYIVALQQEEVVLGLFNPFLALLAGTFSDGLHHLDSVRFCKRKFHKYLFLKVIPKNTNNCNNSSQNFKKK